MEGEIVHLPMIENADAPGALPRRFWSPGCDSAVLPIPWFWI